MAKEDEKLNIKVTDYKDKSGAKIDFYDKHPSEADHKSIHVKVDYEKKNYTVVDNINGKKETSSGNCFLTTSCLKYFTDSFDDNCYELETLRWFRDNFVSQEDISHYYQIAPIIVEAIDRSTFSEIVYDYIYENVVKTCVEAIENGNYNFAYENYKNSILSLEERFTRKEYQFRLIKAIKSHN